MAEHAVELARRSAGLTQRGLAQATGISQSTLSRIISGERAAKVPELIAVAEATGWSLGALSGRSDVVDRAECAARVTNGADGDGLRGSLLRFLELDAYLEDQAIW